MPEISVDEIPEQTGGIKRTKMKREVDQKADELRERLTLPPVPAFEMNDKQWEEYSRLLTGDMWTQISSMYLYRLYPKIIVQLVDPTNRYKNIDKLNRIANVREHIIRLHGGGKYKLDVNKSRKKGEEKLCQVFIDIPITEADPILDYRMLDLSSSDNTGYVTSLKAKGVLDDRGNPMHSQQQNNGQSTQDLMQMFREMMGIYQKMNTDQQLAMREKLQNDKEAGLGGQIGNLLLERMKQDNPNAMLTVFTTMMDKLGNKGSDLAAIVPLFISMMGKSTEQSEAMLKMQAENHRATLELLKDMKAPKGGGGEDNTLSGLKNAMEVFSMMDDLRGGGGPKGTWETVKDIAVDVGVPILNAITNIYAIAKGQAPGQPLQTTPNPTQPATASTGKVITSGDLARQAARDAATQKPAQAPAETQPVNGVVQPEVIEVDQQTAQIRQLLGQAGGMIVEFMKQDRDGVDLAQHIVGLYTKVAHAQIASVGEDRLMAEIVAFAPLWNQLSVFGEPAVRKFVHEFVDYENLLANDPNYMEEDIEEEPIDVSTIPTTKKRGRK